MSAEITASQAQSSVFPLATPQIKALQQNNDAHRFNPASPIIEAVSKNSQKFSRLFRYILEDEISTYSIDLKIVIFPCERDFYFFEIICT